MYKVKEIDRAKVIDVLLRRRMDVVGYQERVLSDRNNRPEMIVTKRPVVIQKLMDWSSGVVIPLLSVNFEQLIEVI